MNRLFVFKIAEQSKQIKVDDNRKVTVSSSLNLGIISVTTVIEDN